MRLESSVKIACKRAYKKKYGPMFLVKNEQGANSGIPDITICHRGLFVGIELKRSEKHKPTLQQQARLYDIIRSGGISGVAYNVETFMAIVKFADEKAELIKNLLTKKS